MGAVFGKFDGNAFANTAGCAGYNGHFIFE
jgi:hypothetical protein